MKEKIRKIRLSIQILLLTLLVVKPMIPVDILLVGYNQIYKPVVRVQSFEENSDILQEQVTTILYPSVKDNNLKDILAEKPNYNINTLTRLAYVTSYAGIAEYTDYDYLAVITKDYYEQISSSYMIIMITESLFRLIWFILLGVSSNKLLCSLFKKGVS